MKRLLFIFSVLFAIPAYAQTPNIGVQAPYFSSTEDLPLGHGWQLRARTLNTLLFPVPTLQPQTAGVPLALDLQPLGSNPTESSGNGWTWFDACNADVMNNNNTPITCGRTGVMTINGAPAGYTGTMTFNGAPAGNFWLVTGTLPRWGVAFNGNFLPYADNAYSLGSATNRATTIYAVNGTIQTSDVRDKDSIEPTKLGLDYINRLHPITFRWRVRDDGQAHQGLIAQDVLAAAGVEPSGVVMGEHLGINYSEQIGPLVRAVQELSAKVEALERGIK